MDGITNRTIAAITKALNNKRVLGSGPEIDAHTLFEDIEVDQLDRLCAAMEVEETFGIEISDTAMESWQSVSDVVATVRECLRVA